MNNLKLTGTIIGVMCSLFLLGSNEDLLQKVECLQKPIQYQMYVQDGSEYELIYICETDIGIQTMKDSILQDIINNQTKSEEATSPSIYAILIANNDEPFLYDAADQIFTKYDSETHTFNGDDMGLDFQEQRQLIFNLARIKCGGECPIVGETPNEQVYNLLSNSPYARLPINS